MYIIIAIISLLSIKKMANMRRSRTGDWSVVIGPGPSVHFCIHNKICISKYYFRSVRVVANLRRCLHYHITSYLPLFKTV